MLTAFSDMVQPYAQQFHPVVLFDPTSDLLTRLDFTGANTTLTAAIIEDTTAFCQYINRQLDEAKAILVKKGISYGIGGYAELRTVYSRSRVFDAPVPGEEPRRLHLGTDIWGPAGTPVYAFMDGTVHSVANNDRYGDYGATIILQHHLGELSFCTLYGHLSVQDIQHVAEGQCIKKGQLFAHFGEPHENGHWPPHLHFQVILDMQHYRGDYPGVCKFSEKEQYLRNSPDPDVILRLNRYIRNNNSYYF
jgi:murein DD-endopeptidase MepM/ murein hydrolase activator NlpD